MGFTQPLLTGFGCVTTQEALMTDAVYTATMLTGFGCVTTQEALVTDGVYTATINRLWVCYNTGSTRDRWGLHSHY